MSNKFFLYTLLSALLLGCGSPTQNGKNEKDFLQIDEDTTPEERKYLEAGKPFILAIANEQFDKAYDLLSSHAKARMSLNQFDHPRSDAQAAKNEKEPLKDVSKEKFIELMKNVIEKNGKPTKVENLQVFETDPKILSGNVKSDEDRISVIFAIGAMPKSIPADIRRASMRGQILCELTEEDIQKIVKTYQIPEEEVREDDQFIPNFTVKFVLVEKEGELKVGYFVFLPPSMFD